MRLLKSFIYCHLVIVPTTLTIIILLPFVFLPIETASLISLWATVAVFFIIVSRAVADAWAAFLDDKRDLASAYRFGDREVEIVAEDRFEVAKHFARGFGTLFLLIIISVIGLLVAPPLPDTSIFNALSRLFLTYATYSFWRAKLRNRRTRLRLEEFYRTERKKSNGQTPRL